MFSTADKFDEDQIHDHFDNFDKLFADDMIRDIQDPWEERFYAMDYGSDGVIDGLDALHWLARKPEFRYKSVRDLQLMVDPFLAKFSGIGSAIITWDDANRQRDDFFRWNGY